MERREFIKQGCFACMALGAGIISTSLASCSTLPIVKTSLEGDRIAFDPVNFTNDVTALLLRAKRLEHDILIVKNPNDTYRALYMQCTHNHFDLSCNKNQIFCTSHGAEFDLEGNVTRGPAQKKLKTFPVISEGGKLFVHIV